MKRPNLGQSTAEYFIIMAVILAALLATGLLGRVKGASFRAYFNQAAEIITTVK